METEVRASGVTATQETQVVQAIDKAINGIVYLEDKLGLSGKYTAVVGGWLFILCSFFITFDVIGRRYFQFSSKATDEMTGYVLAVGTSLSFLIALYTKAHVRIDAVLAKLSLRIQAYMNMLALLFLNFFLVVAVWRVWTVAFFSFEQNAQATTVHRTPLGWPQGIWALGFSTFGLLALLMLVEAILQLVRGRYLQVASKFGVSGIAGEVEEAMEDAIYRLGRSGVLKGADLEEAIRRVKSGDFMKDETAEEALRRHQADIQSEKDSSSPPNDRSQKQGKQS